MFEFLHAIEVAQIPLSAQVAVAFRLAHRYIKLSEAILLTQSIYTVRTEMLRIKSPLLCHLSLYSVPSTSSTKSFLSPTVILPCVVQNSFFDLRPTKKRIEFFDLTCDLRSL